MSVVDKIDKYLITEAPKPGMFSPEEKKTVTKIGKKLRLGGNARVRFSPYRTGSAKSGEMAEWDLNDDWVVAVIKEEDRKGKIVYSTSFYSEYDDDTDYLKGFNEKEIYSNLKDYQQEYEDKAPLD